MRKPIVLEYHRRPSALRYMVTALLPSPPFRAEDGLIDITARWRGLRPSERELAALGALWGERPGDVLPLLYLQVVGFRLQMALLTQPAFPLPIWRVLQIRNRIHQHRSVACDATLDLELRIAGHRVLEKGLEVELALAAREGAALVWESVTTFYARGRYGAAGAPVPEVAAPPSDGERVASWWTAVDGRLAFGRLSGDYNGIHLFDVWARRFGFPHAFLHPQRVLGQCLARLDGAPRSLEAWLKGPVPYGVRVDLRAAAEPAGSRFALFVEGDERPAIVGRLGG